MGSFCFSWIGLTVGPGVRASLYCCKLCINSQEQFLSPFRHYKHNGNTVQHLYCTIWVNGELDPVKSQMGTVCEGFLYQNANISFVLCTDCLWHLGCDIHPYSGCVGQLRLPGDVSLHLFWTITGTVMLSIFAMKWSMSLAQHLCCTVWVNGELDPVRSQVSTFPALSWDEPACSCIPRT